MIAKLFVLLLLAIFSNCISCQSYSTNPSSQPSSAATQSSQSPSLSTDTPTTASSSASSMTTQAPTISTDTPTTGFSSATSGSTMTSSAVTSGTSSAVTSVSYSGTTKSTSLTITITSTSSGISSLPVISYDPINTVYVDIPVLFTPNVTGSPTLFTISPSLPNGLNFDTTTGYISGTIANSPSSIQSYSVVVSASNSIGSSSTNLILSVAMPSFNYPNSNINLIISTSIQLIPNIVPSNAFNQFSSNNVLPSGLSLNAMTGVISGSVTSSFASSQFIITATNSNGGTATTTLTIGVGSSLSITITSSYLTLYAGNSAIANGTASGNVQIVNGGGSVINTPISPVPTSGNSVQWTWKSPTIASSQSVTLTTPAGDNLILTIVLLPTAPIVTVDSSVILLSAGTYTNTGVVNNQSGGAFSIICSLGTISVASGKWSWTLSESKRNLQTFVMITATDTASGMVSTNFFFLQQNSTAITFSNILFSLSLTFSAANTNAITSNDLIGINAATSRILKVDPSLVTSQVSGRRMLGSQFSSTTTTVSVLVTNLPPSQSLQFIQLLTNSMNNGNYVQQMSYNYYNGNTIASLSFSSNGKPVAINVQAYDSNSASPLLLPVWAICVISIGGFFAILLVYLFCCKNTNPCNKSISVSKLTHPKSAYLYDGSNTNQPYALSHEQVTPILKNAQQSGFTIFFQVQPSGETLSLDVNLHDTVHQVKEQLLIEFPHVSNNVNDLKILFGGKTLPDSAQLDSTDVLNCTPFFIVLVSPRSVPKLMIFLNIQHTNERMSILVEPTITARMLKERIVAERQDISMNAENIQLLFGGRLIENNVTLASSGVASQTTIHVILLNRSKSLKMNNSLRAPVEKVNASGDLLLALSRRNDKDMKKRLEARKIMFDALDNDKIAVNSAISSLLEKEVNRSTESLGCDQSVSWIPLNDEETEGSAAFDTVFAVGTAKQFQRTEFYTLIGPSKVNGPEIQLGLVVPLNYRDDGNMEGVNSIVWQAVVNARTVVLKGMLPFSSMEGYENEFATHDSEYKIPLSFPQHSNIISILHQFTGSSCLVYPWISPEVRNLNEEFYKSSGRRFIRRYTTYIVMEYYPSTLRRVINEKKARHDLLSERELCFMALQLLSAVDHLWKYKVSHRDIKDDNVFIAKDGRLVLADFGCAIGCDEMRYQSINDLTSKIGSTVAIAPEVHDAVRSGPSNKTKLWDILKYNDIYAVGSLLFRALDLNLPASSGPVYNYNDIPHLPSSRFSPMCDAFFRKLVSFNPNERPTTAEAIEQLEVMLFGPSIYEKQTIQSINDFLIQRRLDLVFQAAESPSSLNFGSNSDNFIWPLTSGIERESCVRFLNSAKAEKIVRFY